MESSTNFPGSIAGQTLRVFSLAQAISVPTASALSASRNVFPPANITALATLLGGPQSVQLWLDLATPPILTPAILYPRYDAYLGKSAVQIGLRTRAYWPQEFKESTVSSWVNGFLELDFGRAGSAHGSGLEEFAFLGTVRYVLDGILGGMEEDGSGANLTINSYPVPLGLLDAGDPGYGAGFFPWSQNATLYGAPWKEAVFGDVEFFAFNIATWAVRTFHISLPVVTEILAGAVYTHPTLTPNITTDPFQAGTTLVNLWRSSFERLTSHMDRESVKTYSGSWGNAPMVMPLQPIRAVEFNGLFNRFFVPAIPCAFLGTGQIAMPLARVEFEGQLIRMGDSLAAGSVPAL